MKRKRMNKERMASSRLGKRFPILTPNALRILTAIMDGARRGRQPDYRELMDMLGFTGLNAISGHLRRLRRLGLLEPQPAPGQTRCTRATVRFIPANDLR